MNREYYMLIGLIAVCAVLLICMIGICKKIKSIKKEKKKAKKPGKVIKSKTQKVYKHTHKKRKLADEHARERAKMTNSLRYNIFKRDDFRCQICGHDAKDGVKLHVDHIKPIAKGGKTEEENLRTLCSRCNSGKRDKYDPRGKN